MQPTPENDTITLYINQSCKYRYFKPPILTIFRIAVAFHQIYKKPWVNTGASKGGMTSVFHRRFYPKDVDGTVADVAPISYSTSDDRYVDFVEQVGGDDYRECRNNLQKIQIGLLEHREELVPLINGTFSTLGSADVAFEHSVAESTFLYWQYSHPDDPEVGCDKIPVNGNPKDMFDYLQKINEITSYTDTNIARFTPYCFQAATQLGNPNYSNTHLVSLRKYPFTIDSIGHRKSRSIDEMNSLATPSPFFWN